MQKNSFLACSESRFKLGFCEWPSSSKYGAEGSIQLGWSEGMPSPDNSAKLKQFWCVFHDFQPKNVMSIGLPILNASVVLPPPWLSLINTFVQRWSWRPSQGKCYSSPWVSTSVSAIVIYTCQLWNHPYISRLSKHGMCLLKCKRFKQGGCPYHFVFIIFKPRLSIRVFLQGYLATSVHDEGLPGVLGNKGTLAKYRREQGNISQFLGTGEQNSKNYKGEQITKMCGNMGT